MDTRKKDNVLKTLSELLLKNRQNIIAANLHDLSSLKSINESMIDRLKVDVNKIMGMVASIRQTMKLKDPEGIILYSLIHENGLRIENKTVPFGKILIIYESRPDVTIEAPAIAFKAGNKVLLKGGKESRETNKLLVQLWKGALSANGVDENYVNYLDISREETRDLIKNNSHEVDLIIPRGAPELIDFVVQNTEIPVIISGRGNNFLYIDRESDFDMAISVIINGKQRVSVCNALDKVLIHQGMPDIKSQVSKLVDELRKNSIEIIGDKKICNINNEVQGIRDETIFGEEFLCSKILLGVAASIDEAIDTINEHSGGHSAAIISTNSEAARKFQDEVDCAAVYHNASTRFTDGGQFGLGAEMAISTQKLHFRGPIGLNQMVTNKWYIYGDGQTRE